MKTPTAIGNAMLKFSLTTISRAREPKSIFDDRHFKLDVLPQNIPEELVANNYYYNIAGEFEKLSNIYGENEALKISARNTRNNFQEKVYIKEFVVKNLSVVKKDELKITESPMPYSLKD